MAHLRVDRWLSTLGYCSRSQAKQWLKAHYVTLNSQRILDPSVYADESLLIDNEPLGHPEGLFLAFHKPAGYVSSHTQQEGPTLYELLPPQWMRRHPTPATVGRLDKDTSGLILITDQMPWIHRLAHPRKKVEKGYRVHFKGSWSMQKRQLFESGTLLLQGEKKPCLPARVEECAPNIINLYISEGRFHQVKRMFEAVDCSVHKLHRFQFGTLTLGDLQEGGYRVVDFSIIDESSP